MLWRCFLFAGGHAALSNGWLDCCEMVQQDLQLGGDAWHDGLRLPHQTNAGKCTHPTLDLHHFAKSPDHNVSPLSLRQSTNTATSRHSGYRDRRSISGIPQASCSSQPSQQLARLSRHDKLYHHSQIRHEHTSLSPSPLGSASSLGYPKFGFIIASHRPTSLISA